MNEFAPKGVKGFQEGHKVPKEIREKIKASMKKRRGNSTSFKEGHKTNLGRLFPKHKYPLHAMRNKKHSQKTKELMIKNHADFNGKNNPNYIDGNSYLPYNPEFNKILKEKIKNRDNNKCQLLKTKHSGRLDVHHIDYNKNNNSENNLITLCHYHNIKANKNREYWKGILMEMLE